MPELLVDIDTIGANTEAVARLLRERDLHLVAVTKGCMGEPRVATAMLAAGAVALADSRDHNLRRLRAALPQAELHRISLPSSAGDFERADVHYISSWANAEAVGRGAGRRAPGGAGRGTPHGGAAAQQPAAAEPRGAAGPPVADGRRGDNELHMCLAAPSGSVLYPGRVMLYVETGDEREGIPIEQLMELAERVAGDPRLRLEGVATNYACLRGAPEGIRASVEAVAAAARELRAAGVEVPRVSGGNSSLLWLVARGEELPPALTELRCGEALLLGHDALRYDALPGCREDGCRLRAEVVEEYTKRSAGGSRRRLVLAAGHQDLGRGTVRFTEPDLEEVGRSAGYLVVEATRVSGRVPVGTKLEMIPDYEALSTAWMSPHVDVKLAGS